MNNEPNIIHIPDAIAAINFSSLSKDLHAHIRWMQLEFHNFEMPQLIKHWPGLINHQQALVTLISNTSGKYHIICYTFCKSHCSMVQCIWVMVGHLLVPTTRVLEHWAVYRSTTVQYWGCRSYIVFCSWLCYTNWIDRMDCRWISKSLSKGQRFC